MNTRRCLIISPCPEFMAPYADLLSQCLQNGSVYHARKQCLSCQPIGVARLKWGNVQRWCESPCESMLGTGAKCAHDAACWVPQLMKTNNQTLHTQSSSFDWLTSLQWRQCKREWPCTNGLGFSVWYGSMTLHISLCTVYCHVTCSHSDCQLLINYPTGGTIERQPKTRLSLVEYWSWSPSLVYRSSPPWAPNYPKQARVAHQCIF